MRRELLVVITAVLLGLAGCDQAQEDSGTDGTTMGDDGTRESEATASGPEPAGAGPARAEPAEGAVEDPPPADPPSAAHAEQAPARPGAGQDGQEIPDPELAPSPLRRLSLEERIVGELAPKSVVASGTGEFFAQNMMYMHTISVYDRERELLATIPDTVDLEQFGLADQPTKVRGAPVEAAFTSDGTHAYVSNYSMYGPGFHAPGSDQCSPDEGRDDSFVYRVDVGALAIDEVIPVGSTPKYVAVTPDDEHVLVTNWCSYDLSVIAAASGEEIERVDIGRYPRGIAVDADSQVAYVAVMGSTDVAVVSLDDFEVDWLSEVGDGPRHLVLDPDGRHLYVTLNRDDTVAKVDLGSGEVVDQVSTGSAPRTMDVADDGGALYVVNYHSDTLSKVATEDMSVLQEVETDHRPIGVTYDRATSEVWVATYSGTLMVFADR